MSQFNIFKQTSQFRLISSDLIDISTGYFIAKNIDNKHNYLLYHENKQKLEMASKFPMWVTISADTSSNNPKNLNQARIEDPEPKNPSEYIERVIPIETIMHIRGAAVMPNTNRDLSSVANNPKMSKMNRGVILYDETPINLNNYNSNPKDPDHFNDAASRSFITMNPEGVAIASKGSQLDVGGDRVNISSGGVKMPGDETDHGEITTTSLNFLQHYFIGIANAVSLPMPHMINLPKMISIGVFVEKIVSLTRNTVKSFNREDSNG